MQEFDVRPLVRLPSLDPCPMQLGEDTWVREAHINTHDNPISYLESPHAE